MKCFCCSKEIIILKNCTLCENLFCSDSCTEAHKITYHRINKTFMNNLNFYQPVKAETKNEIISHYITKGTISQNIHYNPIYKLENFDQVMDNKNKPRILGSGSYGQVYLCINRINKKYFAIKHMDKSRLNKALKTLAGIYTEIDLQSRISHPNIVQLLYVQESKISFDLVMECAFYGSLFDFIRKNKCLSEEISFKYFMQVVNAIYFLHQNDLIHRDIKPENLLLYDNNNVKLCDFGWCVGLNGGERGTFCGTTEYMAPEMVNQKVYSKEIDIWSLGVLLYEMLHGYSPFIPKKMHFNEREVMENIKIHNLKFDKKVSIECKELICHLLDENRQRRYKIEDIFNSNFVKKYENQLLNPIKISNINNYHNYNNTNHNQNNNYIKIKNQNKFNKLEIKEDNINSNDSKYVANITNDINIITNCNENYNKKENNFNYNIDPKNKTENNFFQRKINKIIFEKNNNINSKSKDNNNIITPRKKISEINKEYILKEKIDSKIISYKINEKKNIEKIYEIQKKTEKNQKKEDESYNIIPITEDNDKESSIINNYSIETEKTENNNINIKMNNNKKNDINSNNINIYNNGNNNQQIMVKRHPIGACKINNNKNKNELQNINDNNNIKRKCVKDINIIHNKINFGGLNNNNNSNNNNSKNKSLDRKLIIKKKINSPIKIKMNNNENHNYSSNIKQKQKMIKTFNSNVYKNKKDKSLYNIDFNYNNNINDINNRTQMIEMKDPKLFINEKNLKMRNYSDLNPNSFKNVLDKEFFIDNNNTTSINNPQKKISTINSNLNNITSDDTNESLILKNINYFIIGNKYNFISPEVGDQYQNKKIIKGKSKVINNIILYPYSKVPKTPVKNNTHKNIIKTEKETIDNEEDTKKENNHKSKIKSKSYIKNIKKDNRNDNNNKNNSIEKNNSNNNYKNNLTTVQIKPKILNDKKNNSELGIIMESLIGKNNYNSHQIHENKFVPLNKNSSLTNNIISNIPLNKTIKIKNAKKRINEEKILSKQINNSFNGVKTIKKIEDKENKNKMVSPIKILGYHSKKFEQIIDSNMSVNSKIIDERDFEVENNDDSDDEKNKTPRKTTDKVKIFPIKLLNDISKKFN